MRCEVVAVGTELLLGQIVDTNSSWLGEQLALAGIDSHFQARLGDHHARITARAADAEAAAALLAGEEARLRSCPGDLVFATDGDTMESTVVAMRAARGRFVADLGLAGAPAATPEEAARGTTHLGIATAKGERSEPVRLPGERRRAREYAVIRLFDLLRLDPGG